MPPSSELEVAYIMKGFPRVSETFISNEIYLLEQLGLKLRVFAIQALSEKRAPALVEAIQAPVTYVPEARETADAQFGRWLRHNLPRLAPSHLRVLMRRPSAYGRMLRQAWRFSRQHRSPNSASVLKTSFIKDFLRAGYIAAHVIASGRIGHLHGHFCHGSTTMTMFASQLTGLPFSFTAHAKDIYLPKLNPGDLLQRKIRAAQFVATCTGANREHLQQLCPEATHIHTIYHGLDTTRFTPAARSLVSQAPPVILAVGRFVEKKGFPLLIRACHDLKAQRFRFRCRIIGEADEQTEAVASLIRELELDDIVSLHDAVPQDVLRHAYRESAIFALPCQIVGNGDRDGIPNVLVEAMATGLAVVSTDISGIPELVTHEIDGLLIPQQDSVALAKALGRLLQEPAYRLQLGNNARANVCRRFDSSRTTEQLKSLFDACLATAGRRVA